LSDRVPPVAGDEVHYVSAEGRCLRSVIVDVDAGMPELVRVEIAGVVSTGFVGFEPPARPLFPDTWHWKPVHSGGEELTHG
jgi:hypothetical protein